MTRHMLRVKTIASNHVRHLRRCHDGLVVAECAASVAAQNLTPRELVEDLMRVYDARTQEDLARKLNKSLRTIQRWFANDGMNWENAIELLQLAGRLQTGEIAEAAAEQERARVIVSRLADEVEQLGQLL